jgi:hypothetical protein
LSNLIKLVGGTEVTLSNSSSNTILGSVNNARLVRLLNVSNSNCLIIQQQVYANGIVVANVGTISLASGSELLLEKVPSDLLITSTSNSVLACSIGFAN